MLDPWEGKERVDWGLGLDFWLEQVIWFDFKQRIRWLVEDFV